jgi:hypothetical protein
MRVTILWPRCKIKPGLPANMRMQSDAAARPEIVGILETISLFTVIPTYECGAADAQLVRRYGKRDTTSFAYYL